MSTRIVIVLSCLVIGFASASSAHAQSKCDAGKLKEYGKKVFCLEKVDSKAAKKGEPVDPTKEQKCIDKFADKCAKAEDKGDCTGAVKDCADLMTEADTCRAAADGPGAPSCPADGTQTGCYAYILDTFCSGCCSEDINCASVCLSAAVSSCNIPADNIACDIAINAAGCAPECCP